MAERLYGEFLDDSGVLYRIGIHDADFMATATEVRIRPGVALDIDTPSRAFTEALAPGTLDFTIVIQDPDETLKTDIVESRETRFSVQMDRDGDFYWCGALVPDIGEIADEGPEYDMRLKAVCGLGPLADYEYIDESATSDKWTNMYSGFDRLINIIARCLKKLPHIQTHYTGSTYFIACAINWHHSASAYDDPDNTNDPFYNVYALNAQFNGIQNTGNAKPLSCAAVIDTILTAFNARIVQVSGKWVIEQYETRTNLTDNRVRRYAYAIAAPSLDGFDQANTTIGPGQDTTKLTGGTYGYLKAAREVWVTQDTKTRYNLAQAMAFDEASVSAYSGGVVFWDGINSTFRAKATIAGKFTNGDIPTLIVPIGVSAIFKLRVTLGAKYLDQTVQTNWPFPSTTQMVWTGSTADVEIKVDIGFMPAIGDTVDFSKEFDFVVSTPTGTQGDLNVDFVFDRLVNGQSGATISDVTYDYTVTFDMFNPYFAIYYDEEQVIGKQVYQVLNNTYQNQGIIKLNTLLGDAVGLNDTGALRYINTGEYFATSDWEVRDTGSPTYLSDLLGRRILQAQSTSRRALRTTLYGPIAANFDTAIIYDSVTYFFQGGTFYPERSELSGRWVELDYENISMTTAINADTDTSNYDPPPVGPGTVNQNTGGTTSNADGNGIYTGDGTVPDGTVATLGGSFSMLRTGASGGDEITLYVDDGSDTNQVKIEAGTGVRIVATGDTISLEGETALADVITVSTIGANQNDYAALDGANTGRLAASAAYNITGIAGGTDGRVIALHNIGSEIITLTDADTGSAAANRFDIGANYAILPKKCAIVQYDNTSARWRVLGSANGLQYFTEAYTTSTATTASLTATSGATNVGVALVTKGSGALTRVIPDGTSTGGDARGSLAVDLQKTRSASTQVASGIVSVVAGGVSNTASGTNSAVLGGSGNVASGSGASVTGGVNNTCSGDYGFAFGGLQAVASLYGQCAKASGAFSENGDAQMSFFIMRRAITGTAQFELTIDGSSQAILPSTNRIWNFSIHVAGVCSTVGNGSGINQGDCWASWHLGVIKKIGTTTSIVGTVQSPATAQADTGMSTTVITIDADDSTEALRVQVTPPTTTGSTSVTRWMTKVELTEVSYT